MIDPPSPRRATRRGPSPRWLALVFPWLPTDRLRATRAHLFVHDPGAPVAMVERRGAIDRVVARDRVAAAAGVAPGLGLADARAMVPGLLSFAHRPHADLDWLDGLADACLRYADRVVPHPPDALLVELGGSAAAFGGERGLVADLEHRMARRGVAVRHALGDTSEIALALARHAGAPAPDEGGAVRRLPVAALDLDEEAVAALAAAGLRTVGDLMARPAAEIAARVGGDAATTIRRLAGEASPAGAPRPPAASCRVERRPAGPVASPGELAALFASLAGDLVATLARRGEVARRWRARLFRADGPMHQLIVDADDGDGGAALVATLRHRLGRLRSGDGYDLLRLEAIAAGPPAARLLIPDGAGAGAPPTRPPARPRGTPRRAAPDQAALALPCPAADRPLVPPDAPARPIHLFDPPEAVDRMVVADGAPARFRWRRRTHEVARVAGPERIAGQGGRPGDEPADRDYFRVEDRRGRRLWLFRLGGREAGAPRRWYVHGLLG